MKTLNILDIPISQITSEEAINKFMKLAEDKEKKHFAATPNAEIILKAQTDSKLKNSCNTAISISRTPLPFSGRENIKRKTGTKSELCGN